MYPNDPQYQPQPQPQVPLDYLNQIAPQQVQRGRFSKKQLLVIGLLGIIVVVIILSILASALGSHTTQKLETIAAKLNTTNTISSAAQTNIKDSTLQSLNVALQLNLTNDIRDIATPLASQGASVTNLDKSIVSANAGTQITNNLEDARLNGVYDNTYTREMAYQLSTILNLMQTVYNNTHNTALKTYLSSSFKSLSPIQKQFDDFNSTTS